MFEPIINQESKLSAAEIETKLEQWVTDLGRIIGEIKIQNRKGEPKVVDIFAQAIRTLKNEANPNLKPGTSPEVTDPQLDNWGLRVDAVMHQILATSQEKNPRIMAILEKALELVQAAAQ
jgi:hypothetical protein